MKRTLILMLVLSCLITVAGCKKDKGSDAGTGSEIGSEESSGVGSSASAQGYSGASLEELMKEMQKLAEDYQAGKISVMEYSKRAEVLANQLEAAEKAVPPLKIKKRGDAKQATLHIINIPLYQIEDDSWGGEHERRNDYVPQKIKVRGNGYISVSGMGIKDANGRIANGNLCLANADEKVPTPSGDSITVKLLSRVTNDEYIDFEDGVYMVYVNWSPAKGNGSMLFSSVPVTFKGGVCTADCKLWVGNLYQ